MSPRDSNSGIGFRAQSEYFHWAYVALARSCGSLSFSVASNKRLKTSNEVFFNKHYTYLSLHTFLNQYSNNSTIPISQHRQQNNRTTNSSYSHKQKDRMHHTPSSYFLLFLLLLLSIRATAKICQHVAWRPRETHHKSSTVMIADNNASLWVFSPSHRKDDDPVNLVLKYRSSPLAPAWKYEFSCQSIPKLALSHSDGDIWALGCPSLQTQLYNGDTLTSKAGSVTLFQWNRTKGKARIVQTIYGKNTTDQLGTSIGMSADGKTIALVASAPSTKKKNNAANYLDVFRWDEESKKWQPFGSTIPDATKVSLSSDGTVLAVMNPQKFMKVYHYDNKRQDWQEEKFQIPRPRGLSSSSMALAGNGRILSLLQTSPAGQSVYIFRRTGVETSGYVWIQDSSIPAPRNDKRYDFQNSFGWVASLSFDGSRIALADPSHRSGSGIVYVYDYEARKRLWKPSGEPISAMVPSRRDSLGRHLHISQDGTQLVAKAVSYTAIYQYEVSHVSCHELPSQQHKEEL
jgi:hypothetical protein